MTDRPAKPVTPVPAATTLLLRDGEKGLEVFMVQRNARIGFAGGALVFPGGKVDAEDSAECVRARCAGAEEVNDNALVFRVAAVREAFEESGLLLARERGDAALVKGDRLKRLTEAYRDRLIADDIGIGEMAETENLELATDLLAPFAHWTTPADLPRRFDTWFFLAPAPETPLGAHDGGETVDSVWIRPKDAIAEAESGQRFIVLATLFNLHLLGKTDTVAAALGRARASRVKNVQPTLVKSGDALLYRIAPDLGYDLTEAPAIEYQSGYALPSQR